MWQTNLKAKEREFGLHAETKPCYGAHLRTGPVADLSALVDIGRCSLALITLLLSGMQDRRLPGCRRDSLYVELWTKFYNSKLSCLCIMNILRITWRKLSRELRHTSTPRGTLTVLAAVAIDQVPSAILCANTYVNTLCEHPVRTPKHPSQAPF